MRVKGEPPNAISKTEAIALTKRRQEKASLSNQMSTVFRETIRSQDLLPPRQLKKIIPLTTKLSWFSNRERTIEKKKKKTPKTKQNITPKQRSSELAHMMTHLSFALDPNEPEANKPKKFK